MDYLMGIDVGTTGVKALLIEADGVVEAGATSEYSIFTPQPLWAEQDPTDWWVAAAAGSQRVLKESGVSPNQIAGVGLTGQMHGLVLLDTDGDVLRPCIMWNDQRTGKQCTQITQEVGKERLLQLTGNPVLPGFTAPKILWVREHEPGVYEQVAHVLLPKDYVRYRLTGEFLSDVSDASGTSLFNVGGRRWSDEMLTALDVPRTWLPEVTESPEASAQVTAWAAKESGLLEGTPVVGGAGDQAAQAIGTGIVTQGFVSVTLGTSGVVFAASDDYWVEPKGKLHTFCHAVPGMWHLMGVTLSAGGSFRWYRDTVGDLERQEAVDSSHDAYEILTEEAACAPAGCEGLVFLPYLSGERTPHADPNARGVFFGLTLRHGKAHMTRAVLEGVSYALRDSLELMRELGLPVEQMRVSGGGGRNSLWRQILADVLDTELAIPDVSEGAAYGAALLASVGVGVYETLDDACQAMIEVSGRVEPSSLTSTYADYYPRYRSLYPALAPEFEAMAELVSKHLEAG